MTRGKRLAMVICLLMAFFVAKGYGDDQPPHGDGHQRNQEERDSSFQEVLEFLGQWETADGEWVDPSSLEWFIETDRDLEKNE